MRSRNVTPLRHHLPADIALLCFNAVLRLAAVCSMFCSCHVLRFNVLHFGVLHCGKVNVAGLLGEKQRDNCEHGKAPHVDAYLEHSMGANEPGGNEWGEGGAKN